MREDIRTITYPLPPNIRAYTGYVNGYYTVLINESLSDDARLREYEHELNHIMNKDFFKEETADQIEATSGG